MKRYILLCMLVFGIHQVSGMTRTRTAEEIKAAIDNRLEATKKLIKAYQELSPQSNTQLADTFLKSIEHNLQALEAEYRALDVSHTALRAGLQNEIRRLRIALDSKPAPAQTDENRTRTGNSGGGQAPNKPRKSCCDAIWECLGRRDVQCAGSLATGILIGRKWKKS